MPSGPPDEENSGLGSETRDPLVSPLRWLALLAVGAGFAAVVVWLFFGTVERVADGRGIVIRDSEFGLLEVAGTVGGRLIEVLVKEGDAVEAGQVIATLRRSGFPEQAGVEDGQPETLHPIRSPRAGRVIEVVVGAGTVVDPGRTILRLESLTGELEVLAYVSAREGKRVRPGMKVRVVPTTVRAHESGHLKGVVNYVSTYPVTRDYLASELGGNGRLADYLLEQGSSIEVDLDLLKDPVTGRPLWSSRHNTSTEVESGLLVDAFVVVEKVRPISLLVPAGL